MSNVDQQIEQKKVYLGDYEDSLGASVRNMFDGYGLYLATALFGIIAAGGVMVLLYILAHASP